MPRTLADAAATAALAAALASANSALAPSRAQLDNAARAARAALAALCGRRSANDASAAAELTAAVLACIAPAGVHALAVAAAQTHPSLAAHQWSDAGLVHQLLAAPGSCELARAMLTATAVTMREVLPEARAQLQHVVAAFKVRGQGRLEGSPNFRSLKS